MHAAMHSTYTCTIPKLTQACIPRSLGIAGIHAAVHRRSLDGRTSEGSSGTDMHAAVHSAYADAILKHAH